MAQIEVTSRDIDVPASFIGQVDHYNAVRSRIWGAISPSSNIRPPVYVHIIERAPVPREAIPVVYTTAKKYQKLTRQYKSANALYDRWKDNPKASDAILTSEKLSDRILREVCERHKIDLHDVLSNRRTKNLVTARFEIAFRLKSETLFSLPQIGKIMNRDHTSILHAIRRYEAHRDGVKYTRPIYEKSEPSIIDQLEYADVRAMI